MPTIDKILAAVNNDPELPILKRTTMYDVLKKMKFKFKKRGQNSMLLERDDLVHWRRDYLRKIRKYRQEQRHVYYTDETWANTSLCRNKIWIDTTIQSAKDAFLRGLTVGTRNPSGNGPRLIILHIGSDDGFLEDGALILQGSNSNSSDYHNEMNSEIYEKWFSQILSKLQPNSVIVIDNASYHSRLQEKVRV